MNTFSFNILSAGNETCQRLLAECYIMLYICLHWCQIRGGFPVMDSETHYLREVKVHLEGQDDIPVNVDLLFTVDVLGTNLPSSDGTLPGELQPLCAHTHIHAHTRTMLSTCTL